MHQLSYHSFQNKLVMEDAQLNVLHGIRHRAHGSVFRAVVGSSIMARLCPTNTYFECYVNLWLNMLYNPLYPYFKGLALIWLLPITNPTYMTSLHLFNWTRHTKQSICKKRFTYYSLLAVGVLVEAFCGGSVLVSIPHCWSTGVSPNSHIWRFKHEPLHNCMWGICSSWKEAQNTSSRF